MSTVVLIASLFVTVQASPNAEQACNLLHSCIDEKDKLFAQCDVILDTYQPPCWKDLKPLLSQLRSVHAKQTEGIDKCLTEPYDHVEGTLTEEKEAQCKAMLPHFDHIGTDAGWYKRVKRQTTGNGADADDRAKKWKTFYDCITTAERHAHICKSIAKCCPRNKKCEWLSELEENHVSATKLRLEMFAVRQQCLAGLDKEGMKAYDKWQPISRQHVFDQDE